ncbi:MAG: hypothetical protein KDC87_13390 [Planctomycetes bacterium]|nr:hypothetical protein [Planctomycetota bacterium]MCB9868387.1 hypothetical protein [Planctomycetota bacterium]
MKTTLTLVCLALLFRGPAARQDKAPAPPRPVAVFAELDGRWRGTFVGYDKGGAELYRIAVEQTYRTIDPHTQRVELRDTMADGKVITGTGFNRAERRKDGTLKLSCEVRKSNGEHVIHRGRTVRGPAGEPQIVWSSDAPRRIETFREWVTHAEGRTRYHIHGMGVYGGTPMLMAGEYQRVPNGPVSRPTVR